MGYEAHLKISQKVFGPIFVYKGAKIDPARKQKRFRLCKLFLRKGGPNNCVLYVDMHTHIGIWYCSTVE